MYIYEDICLCIWETIRVISLRLLMRLFWRSKVFLASEGFFLRIFEKLSPAACLSGNVRKHIRSAVVELNFQIRWFLFHSLSSFLQRCILCRLQNFASQSVPVAREARERWGRGWEGKQRCSQFKGSPPHMFTFICRCPSLYLHLGNSW